MSEQLTTEQPAAVRVMCGKTQQEVYAELQERFPPDELRAKPLKINGNRALAAFYIDARAVQKRLNDVLGIGGWKATYVPVDGSMLCTLEICVEGQWITRQDVGSPSEQPDAGDRLKSAVSDALKRAAVGFGVGAYLYQIPNNWYDYDPVKKKFLQPPIPQLPPVKPAAAIGQGQQQPAKQLPPAAANAAAVPATWKEFDERLAQAQDQLVARGLIEDGYLFRKLREWGERQQIPNMSVSLWPTQFLEPAFFHLGTLLKQAKERARAAQQQQPQPAATPTHVPVGDIGAREEEEIEREQTIDEILKYVDKTQMPAKLLIEQHAQAIGVIQGATMPARIHNLSTPQLRALLKIVARLEGQTSRL